jgi:hypothetical protein
MHMIGSEEYVSCKQSSQLVILTARSLSLSKTRTHLMYGLTLIHSDEFLIINEPEILRLRLYDYLRNDTSRLVPMLRNASYVCQVPHDDIIVL